MEVVTQTHNPTMLYGARAATGMNGQAWVALRLTSPHAAGGRTGARGAC